MSEIQADATAEPGPGGERYWIVLLAESGQSVETVAATLDVDPGVVAYWLDRYRTHGPAGLTGADGYLARPIPALATRRSPSVPRRAGPVSTRVGRWLATVSPLTWVLALAAAGVAQYLLSVQQAFTSGAVVYGLAVTFLILSLVGRRHAAWAVVRPSWRAGWRRWLIPRTFAFIGAGCLGLSLGAVLVPALGVPALILWVVALVASVMAALPPTALESPASLVRWWHRYRLDAWDFALLGSLAAVSLFLRLVDLGRIPAGLHRDEAVFGFATLAVLQGQGVSPFGVVLNDDPALFVYLMAPLVWLAGPNAVGLRLLAVLAGVAIVIAFSIFLRILFGRGAAILGALLVGTSGLFINFSRLALNVPEASFFLTLSLLFLWLAVRHGQAFWWLTSGLVAGLGLYFHFSARLYYLIFALFVVYLLVMNKARFRTLVKGVALAAVGSLVAISPFVFYVLTRGRSLLQHESDRFIFTNWQLVSATYGGAGIPEILGQQVRSNVLAFIWTVDKGQFTFPDSYLISPLVVPLVVLGLALMIVRIRDSRYALLLCWFLVVTVAGSLTIDIPQSHRLLPAVLPLLAGAALVLAATVRTMRRLAGPLASAAAFVAVIGFVAVVGFGDYQAFFGPSSKSRMWEVQAVLADYVAAHPDARYAVLGATHTYFEHDSRRFLAPRAEGSNILNPGVELPSPVPDDKDLVYVVYGNWADYLPYLRGLYPTARFEPVTGQGGRVVFTAVWVPQMDLVGHQGLSGTANGVAPWIARDTRSLFGLERPGPGPVAWSGSFYVPKAGHYTLAAREAVTDLAIDGVSRGRSIALDLSAGWHEIDLTGDASADSSTAALLWQPPGEALAPIPRHLLDTRRLVPLRGRLAAAGSPPTPPTGSFGFRDLARLGPGSQPGPVTWQGSILVKEAGTYALGLRSGGAAELTIDGRPVLARSAEQSSEQTVDAQVDLSAGVHPIVIRYAWQSGPGLLEVLWTPPGGVRGIIPPENFGPPEP